MTPRAKLLRSGIAALIVSALAASAAAAATITIINNDGPLEGFNDPSAAAPVGNNPGTTVGQQRLYVFQYAANLWGAILPSNVEIRVTAQFNGLTCNATSGVLGSAGPVTYSRDFSPSALPGHWYHIATANKLYGFDLSGSDDISIQFNSSIGQVNCLPAGWYYGVDGNEGSQIELLPVVLHEMGHGLGFSTPTNKTTGAYFNSFPSIYDHFLYDNTTDLHWDQMSAAQRLASEVTCNQLAWNGSAVRNRAPQFLGDKPRLRINAPAPIAGHYEVGSATFGAPLDNAGVTADVVLANDGDLYPTNGCEPLVNGGAIAGKIAFVDRGTCPFAVKVKNAQNAGAIAAIVADSIPGCPPAGMSGVDPTITIPSVRITQSDGAAIRALLATGVNATLYTDPNLMAGADADGRVLMYTPSTIASGSTVSHWDVSAEPNLLMEPALNSNLSSAVDLTKWLFADIGWFHELVSVDPVAREGTGLQNSPNPFGPSTTINFSLERDGHVTLAVYDLSGRLVSELHRGTMPAGSHAIPWNGRNRDGRLVPAGIYTYTLNADHVRESKHMVIVR